MFRQDFEFEVTLRDRRVFNVSGVAFVVHNCDCDGKETHAHIEDLEIESVTQTFEAGVEEGREIQPNTRMMAELERAVEDEIYDMLAA